MRVNAQQCQRFCLPLLERIPFFPVSCSSRDVCDRPRSSGRRRSPRKRRSNLPRTRRRPHPSQTRVTENTWTTERTPIRSTPGESDRTSPTLTSRPQIQEFQGPRAEGSSVFVLCCCETLPCRGHDAVEHHTFVAQSDCSWSSSQGVGLLLSFRYWFR